MTTNENELIELMRTKCIAPLVEVGVLPILLKKFTDCGLYTDKDCKTLALALSLWYVKWIDYVAMFKSPVYLRNKGTLKRWVNNFDATSIKDLLTQCECSDSLLCSTQQPLFQKAVDIDDCLYSPLRKTIAATVKVLPFPGASKLSTQIQGAELSYSAKEILQPTRTLLLWMTRVNIDSLASDGIDKWTEVEMNMCNPP